MKCLWNAYNDWCVRIPRTGDATVVGREARRMVDFLVATGDLSGTGLPHDPGGWSRVRLRDPWARDKDEREWPLALDTRRCDGNFAGAGQRDFIRNTVMGGDVDAFCSTHAVCMIDDLPGHPQGRMSPEHLPEVGPGVFVLSGRRWLVGDLYRLLPPNPPVIQAETLEAPNSCRIRPCEWLERDLPYRWPADGGWACSEEDVGALVLEALDRSEEWMRANTVRRTSPSDRFLHARPLPGVHLRFPEPQGARSLVDLCDGGDPDTVRLWGFGADSTGGPSLVAAVGVRVTPLPGGALTAEPLRTQWEASHSPAETCEAAPAPSSGPWTLRLDLRNREWHGASYYCQLASDPSKALECFALVKQAQRRKAVDRRVTKTLDTWAPTFHITETA